MKKKEQVKYKCIYVSGGGTEYDGGVWIKKETDKTITFFCIEPSYFAVDWNKLIIYKNPERRNQHCLRDWKDGTYTIYPDRCGVPHVFEPITKERRM